VLKNIKFASICTHSQYIIKKTPYFCVAVADFVFFSSYDEAL